MDDETAYICKPCPHCSDYIQVFKNEINCNVFRHGAYRSDDLRQIDPHAPKDQCDTLARDDTIYGCGKPFTIVQHDGDYVFEACDYV